MPTVRRVIAGSRSSWQAKSTNSRRITTVAVISQQATDGDAHQHLFPLLVLFDSVNPVPPLIHRLCRDGSEWFFAEALPDARLAAASGRRAPPFDVC